MKQSLATDVYMMLAAATKKAVRQCGGSSSAADLLGGIPRQNVERWYSMRGDECDARSIPLFRLVEIESDIAGSGGIPPVTQALAEFHGFDLVRRSDYVTDLHPVCAIGHLMKEAGSACQTVTDSAADGKFTADERQQCISDLQKVIEAASQALGSLAGADCDAD